MTRPSAMKYVGVRLAVLPSGGRRQGSGLDADIEPALALGDIIHVYCIEFPSVSAGSDDL